MLNYDKYAVFLKKYYKKYSETWKGYRQLPKNLFLLKNVIYAENHELNSWSRFSSEPFFK